MEYIGAKTMYRDGPVRVPAHIEGQWAIHRPLNGAGVEVPRGWRLTHILSGAGYRVFDRIADAKHFIALVDYVNIDNEYLAGLTVTLRDQFAAIVNRYFVTGRYGLRRRETDNIFDTAVLVCNAVNPISVKNRLDNHRYLGVYGHENHAVQLIQARLYDLQGEYDKYTLEDWGNWYSTCERLSNNWKLNERGFAVRK